MVVAVIAVEDLAERVVSCFAGQRSLDFQLVDGSVVCVEDSGVEAVVGDIADYVVPELVFVALAGFADETVAGFVVG